MESLWDLNMQEINLKYELKFNANHENKTNNRMLRQSKLVAKTP